MLILHVITNLSTGGAEHMLRRLVVSHAGNPDYRHVVFSLRDLGTVGPQIRAAGIEVVPLGLARAWQAPAIVSRLAVEIRARNPDIVQTWMYHSDLIGGLAARRAGVRHVVWGVRIAQIGPDMGVSRATLLVRKACAWLSSRVPERIVYVAHSARKVHEAVGYAPDKGVVIPNGYPPPVPADPEALRRELGVESGAFLIGSVGRFNAQKDHRTFIAAARLVARREPRARFVLIGRGLEPDNVELAGLLDRSGCRDRFHLLGERSDVANCLAGLDLFCLHSVSEGFPNVVAEAMNAGLACIVTDVGDAASLVGDTGMVVPPRQPRALADALFAAIAAGPGELNRLGGMARERIAREYSMDAIRRRYEELYAGFFCTGASPEETRGAPAGKAASRLGRRREPPPGEAR